MVKGLSQSGSGFRTKPQALLSSYNAEVILTLRTMDCLSAISITPSAFAMSRKRSSPEDSDFCELCGPLPPVSSSGCRVASPAMPFSTRIGRCGTLSASFAEGPARGVSVVVSDAAVCAALPLQFLLWPRLRPRGRRWVTLEESAGEDCVPASRRASAVVVSRGTTGEG